MKKIVILFFYSLMSIGIIQAQSNMVYATFSNASGDNPNNTVGIFSLYGWNYLSSKNNNNGLRINSFNSDGSVSKHILLHADSHGNVGIDNNNPIAKLDVTGDIRATGIIYTNISNASGDIPNNTVGIFSLSGWNYLSSKNDNGLRVNSFSGDGSTSKDILLHADSRGKVGIGTSTPAYTLDVCGIIRAKEVKVDILGGCDFVFKNGYKLIDLKTLESYIKTNQHLPEIDSEKEMVDNGVNIKDLQMKLLQKMEEMTLYMIDQNKEIESLKQELAELKKK